MLVRTEGLLTQLVFEHSSRIRLKAETSNGEVERDNLTVIDTSDSTEGTAANSKADERANEPSEASTTVSLDSSTDFNSTTKNHVKGKDKDGPPIQKSDTKQPTKDKKDAQNLIGKINNLVTTDLDNIVDGRDFLLVGTLQSFRFDLDLLPNTRISFTFPASDGFLHHFLIPSTWMEVSFPSYSELKEYSYPSPVASAFVGLVTMVVLFPVPGYIVKKVQNVQVQRMKMVLSLLASSVSILPNILLEFKTDARVQDITEGTLHTIITFPLKMQVVELLCS